MKDKFLKNTKFWTAMAGVFTILGTALGDGSINPTEGRNLAVAFVSACLVWLFPNVKE